MRRGIKNMGINGYEYSNLKQEQLKKITSLEKELNQEKSGGNKTILLAFNKNKSN